MEYNLSSGFLKNLLGNFDGKGGDLPGHGENIGGMLSGGLPVTRYSAVVSRA
jgi:hypothetical protein